MEDPKPERVDDGEESVPTPLWVWLVVGALVLIGAALRIKTNDASLLGDELSTIWIVEGNSLGEVLSRIYSDAEISPPLYFVLAWLTTKLGSDPVLIRLPALIAGIVSIPLAWAVGVRMVGRWGGCVAAAVVTFSPFFIFYSATGRAYSLGLMMLMASTLFMLIAIRDGRRRWWVLSVWPAPSRSTAITRWLLPCSASSSGCCGLIRQPASRLSTRIWAQRPCFCPGSRASSLTTARSRHRSPKLYGHGFHDKLVAVQQLLFFQVNVWNWRIGGRVDVWLITVAAIGATAGALYRYWHLKIRTGFPGAVHRGLSLAITLSLSTAVGELLLLAAGSNVFGARNLAATWAGLPFLLGGLVALDAPAIGAMLAALLLVGFGIGAVRTTDPSNTAFDYKAAAGYLEDGAVSRGPVVDAANFTPAPTTSFSLYLPPDRRRYDIGVSPDRPDFIESIFLKEDPQLAVDRAFRGRGPVQVVTLIDPDWVTDEYFSCSAMSTTRLRYRQVGADQPEGISRRSGSDRLDLRAQETTALIRRDHRGVRNGSPESGGSCEARERKR